jgi:hypothetical protein
MFKRVPIKHKQISFGSNGGKFKLYAAPNCLLISTPTHPRFYDITFSTVILIVLFLLSLCYFCIYFFLMNICDLTACVLICYFYKSTLCI